MKRFIRTNKSTAIMLAVLIYFMYATQPDHIPAATKSHEAVYTAKDFSFTGPDSLPAGWTRFRIENKGKDLQHIQLIQLTGGKTRADFEAALKTDPKLAKPPGWMKFAGSPNAIVPGEVGTASVKLASGNYLLICVIPDSKGVPHVAQGMIKTLTVTSSAKPAATAPKSTRVIELSDFSFAIPKSLTAGTQPIEVKNKRNQEHELLLG